MSCYRFSLYPLVNIRRNTYINLGPYPTIQYFITTENIIIFKSMRIGIISMKNDNNKLSNVLEIPIVLEIHRAKYKFTAMQTRT